MERSELEDRVAALEERVRTLEDQAAVLRLVASWGPAVDTGGPDGAAAAGALWADDGVLQSDISRLEGPAAITEMVLSDGQEALIRQGSAHVQALPVVTVEGDHATATNYSRVYRLAGDGHEIWRVSANVWELRRTSAGWRVTRRTNHLIDGGPEARELLQRAYR